jgi:hypothetical protein
MTKYILIIVVLGIVLHLTTENAYAQMMGNIFPDVTPSVQDIQDIQIGQTLYNSFQKKLLTCSQFTNDDFEKIGEYIMDQRFSSTSQHLQMNEQAKRMMGENGEEQMHIRIGRTVTGCLANLQGGGFNMMNWAYGGMMGFSNNFFILPFLIQLFVLIDLILVSILLWKRIKK